MRYPPVQNFVNGKMVDATGNRYLEIISPVDGTVLSAVRLSVKEDLDLAVESAKKAYPGWSKTPIKERVQVFFRYKYLLEKNTNELAKLISEENGKTISEAI